MNATEVFLVLENEENLRLDVLLTKQFPGYSRSYFQNLIEDHLVLVNGELIKKREKPKIGDEIEVCFALTPEISLEPQDIPLSILYEDEHLLAVNKPPGMVVHPAPGHPRDTFVNALLFHCKNLPVSDLRPGIVHRLDKDTSGVLLAAKTTECHRRLVEMFATRQMEKTYTAITIGNPGDCTIDSPIARHPTERKKMAVSLDGKEAISICKTISKNKDIALVEIKLITGRTHQIRVHLGSKGAPVLGDDLYGSEKANERYKAARQMLHCKELKFTHPITKKTLVIEAPFPEDMSHQIKKNSLID